MLSDFDPRLPRGWGRCAAPVGGRDRQGPGCHLCLLPPPEVIGGGRKAYQGGDPSRQLQLLPKRSPERKHIRQPGGMSASLRAEKQFTFPNSVALVHPAGAGSQHSVPRLGCRLIPKKDSATGAKAAWKAGSLGKESNPTEENKSEEQALLRRTCHGGDRRQWPLWQQPESYQSQRTVLGAESCRKAFQGERCSQQPFPPHFF